MYEQGMVVDKAIESSLEKLTQIDNVFKYKVVSESAQLSAVLQLHRNNQITTLRPNGTNIVLFTETDEGLLVVKNMSNTLMIKNIYVLCSHPIVFGFLQKPLLK